MSLSPSPAAVVAHLHQQAGAPVVWLDDGDRAVIGWAPSAIAAGADWRAAGRRLAADTGGGVLGFVGIILGLGTMLGKLMADSGGADQIAQTLIRRFGKDRVHWAMMFSAFLVGIPLFFEIGFVLLIPLVFIVARRSGVSIVKIGIPLLAGLSAVHGLVPPHPGPLLAIGIFNADIGKTIFYGLIVAFPTAIIAGPIFGKWIAKHIPGNPSKDLMDQIAKESTNENLPSFAITLVTILLPVFLMLLKTFADVALPNGHIFRIWMDFIGHPIAALLFALLLAFYTFGSARGFSREQIIKLLDQSLAPVAAIVLIVGAGGGRCCGEKCDGCGACFRHGVYLLPRGRFGFGAPARDTGTSSFTIAHPQPI